MSKFNFSSDDWQEVKVNPWQWIMWDKDNPGQTFIGWIKDVRTETFQVNGENRENLVVYAINSEGQSVRFIATTDLRKKLTPVLEEMSKQGIDWTEIFFKITYTGMVKASSGHYVKTFEVRFKRYPMPEPIKKDIPDMPLPNGVEDIEIDDEIANSFAND
jgi:hypothetical protein